MIRSVPAALTPQTADVLETFRAIAEIKTGCTPEAIRHYIISGATSVEDVLAVVWLARLGGVTVEAKEQDPGPDAGAALRIDRRPAQRTGNLPQAVELTRLSQAAGIVEQHAGGHARLLRFQQRRRHDRQHLGDLPRAPRPSRSGARMRRDAAALPRTRRHRRTRRRSHASLHLCAAGRRIRRTDLASPSKAKCSTGNTPT